MIFKMSLKGYAKIAENGEMETVALWPCRLRESTNPKVRMLNGKVALQRGPIVYRLEEEQQA